MTSEDFLTALQAEIEGYNSIVATEKGDWIVKGFIDIYRRVYTISVDTKVVSKVLELLLIPAFYTFAEKNGFTLHLPPQQNFYPDLTFESKTTGVKFAVDIKSTFKDADNKIKGMTLGAFTGYFRNRKSNKNTLYPYGSYKGHFVLGVIYSQNKVKPDEQTVFTLDDLDSIESVIRDFKFFAQPKFKIASASPGSGNTKNIGSTNSIEALVNGRGIFSELGEELYDDYWMFYLTRDMAKALEIPRPYTNLKTYLDYKRKGINILSEHEEEIKMLSDEEDINTDNLTEDDE